ncbi:UDP-2,3-diacylglucosamine hydrolase [Thalassocella blandensis]|nr:UDP-2,3-diacylglucosamine hydrolase [Thalassocella blandensis]
MNGFTDIASLYSQVSAHVNAEVKDSSENEGDGPSSSGKTPGKKYHFRSLFISDVHLGTKDCKARELNDFLKQCKVDRLYLVGDIFDGWRMKSGVYWNKSFNLVIRRLLKLSKSGVPIYYITGNHDEFLRKYANTKLDNIQLLNRFTHVTAQNKRLLVIHGDQFEGVTRCGKFLKLIGDHGYEFLMFLNRIFNRFRAKYGYGYWSFSGFLKSHLSRAQTYIADYERAVAFGAKKQGFDGVVCGHIHHPAMKTIDGTEYYNTGDWVESCSAVAEDAEGNFRLIHWLEEAPVKTKAVVKPRKKAVAPTTVIAKQTNPVVAEELLVEP